MRRIKVQITYNKATDRWDMLTMKGLAIFDSSQTGIPDCDNVYRIFEGLDKDKINYRILITKKFEEESN